MAVIFAAIATAEAEPTIEVHGDHGDIDVAAVSSQIRGLEPLIKEKGTMWAHWKGGQLIPADAQAKAGPDDQDFVYSFRLSFVPYNRGDRIAAAASIIWAPAVTYWVTNRFVFKAGKVDREKEARMKEDGMIVGYGDGRPGFKIRATPTLIVGLACLEIFGQLPGNKDGLIVAEKNVDWPGPKTKTEKIIAFGAMPIVGGAVFVITKFF